MMRFGVYSLAPLTGLGNTIAYRLRGFYRLYEGIPLRSTACLWSTAPNGAKRMNDYSSLDCILKKIDFLNFFYFCTNKILPR